MGASLDWVAAYSVEEPLKLIQTTWKKDNEPTEGVEDEAAEPKPLVAERVERAAKQML